MAEILCSRNATHSFLVLLLLGHKLLDICHCCGWAGVYGPGRLPLRTRSRFKRPNYSIFDELMNESLRCCCLSLDNPLPTQPSEKSSTRLWRGRQFHLVRLQLPACLLVEQKTACGVIGELPTEDRPVIAGQVLLANKSALILIVSPWIVPSRRCLGLGL